MAAVDLTGSANNNSRCVHLIDDASTACSNGSARVPRNGFFHAGAHKWSLGLDEWHRLTLHVRSHERPVSVIVFQERNERRGNRHQLLGANVHQCDDVARRHQKFAGLTRRDDVLNKALVRIKFSVCLRDRVLGFFHRRQINDVVGNLVINDLAVRRFDKTVLVDATERRETVDKPDVRPFGRFNRTNAPIVGRVNVTNLKTCALASQTARPKSRYAALVRHFRQRVGLIHELRKLR